MRRDAMFCAGRMILAAGLIAACAPAPALAHPNYERVERVMRDGRGRELRLVLSYRDGIMLSDPVKLVVRDPDHHTIAETGWARTISVICARPAACVIFGYGMFSPLPSHIWRLNNGRLEATRSTWLAAFGMVAPLWSDAWGYVVAVGFLLSPWPGLALLWRAADAASRASARSLATVARQVAIALGFLAIAGYYAVCVWMIAMLAELSPLLAIGSAFIVWGVIAFSLRGSRRAAGAI